MCQDFYSFGAQACKTTTAHSHVNALSTSPHKSISSQGQLDLNLFSDTVWQFIPTLSNLHEAFSVLSYTASLLRLTACGEESYL